MKIYLATNGEYSDFSVVAAFRSRPIAERFAGKLDEGDVREMDLLAREPKKVVRYSAEVERFWDQQARGWGPWPEIATWSYDAWDFEVADEQPRLVERENFIRAVGYESQEQAVKVVSDRLARARAVEAGIA